MPTASQAEPPAPSPATVAVGAVVVDGAGRVLLVRRAKPPSAGAWTLPGGRLEPGESLEAAVVREVREETSLRTRVVCALGVVDVAREGYAYAIHEHLLVPVDPAATAVAGDDAADVRWATRGELAPLGVRPDAVAVVERGLAEARARALLPGCP